MILIDKHVDNWSSWHVNCHVRLDDSPSSWHKCSRASQAESYQEKVTIAMICLSRSTIQGSGRCRWETLHEQASLTSIFNSIGSHRNPNYCVLGKESVLQVVKVMYTSVRTRTLNHNEQNRIYKYRTQASRLRRASEPLGLASVVTSAPKWATATKVLNFKTR